MHNNFDNDTTYALSLVKNRLVHIDEVERGLACNCICPCCKQPMIANKGEKNQYYFSHERKGGNTFNKDVCRNETMHRLAIQIIRDRKSVMLPPYENIEKAKKVNFVSVEVEERNDRSDIQPDIVGITDDGKRYLIEIKYSHSVNDVKKRKIYSDDLTCVEIDICQQKMNDLKDFLLDSPSERKWINNKYAFDSIVDYYKKHGKDVRVISIDECKRKYALENCSSCLNSKIMHCGKQYIICSSVSECQYTKQETWRHILDEVYEKPKREDRYSQTCFTSSRHSYAPARTRVDVVDESKYPCHPGNLFTTIDDYYDRIKCNQIFYKDGDEEYSILNHWKSKDGEKFGVLIKSKNEPSRLRYVIVTRSDIFIHEWSKVEYDSENAATFSLKRALGLE